MYFDAICMTCGFSLFHAGCSTKIITNDGVLFATLNTVIQFGIELNQVKFDVAKKVSTLINFCGGLYAHNI